MQGRKFLTLPQLEKLLIYILLILLPTQLGKHFWPDFAILNGLLVDYLSPTIYITDLIIAFLFLIVVLSYLTKKRNATVHTHRISKVTRGLFLSFVGYLLLTIILSGNYLNGLYHLLKFLEFSFVVYLFSTRAGTSIPYRRISALLAIGVLGESCLAILQYIQQGSIGGLLYFFGERTFTASTPGIANASINGDLILRSYGTFSHPNVLAGYLLVSMVLIAGWLLPRKLIQEKILAYAALFLGSIALVLTFSRVAIALWILLLVGAAVVDIYKHMKRNTFIQSINKKMMLLSVIVLVAGLSLFHPITNRFLQTTFSEEAVIQRQLLNEVALRMIADHPFIGVGLGNFLPELATFPTASSYGMYIQPVHNLFLLAAVEIGLVGLLILLYFLLFLLLRLVRRKDWIVPTALSVIILIGLSDHYWLTLQQGQLFLAIIIGLCNASGKTPLMLGAAKIIRM